MITDLWLELVDGEVVDSGAGSGGEVLERVLATDDGARRFGETAMVPQSGAVAVEELVWNNVLYDENDGCHIALGQSYPAERADSQDAHRSGAGTPAELIAPGPVRVKSAIPVSDHTIACVERKGR